MAYFPNGTSFAMWQDEHCSDCLNYRDNGSGSFGCAITDAHFCYASELLDENGLATAAGHILNAIVPDEGPDAFKCRMFVTQDILRNEQAKRDGQRDLERYLAAMTEGSASPNPTFSGDSPNG